MLVDIDSDVYTENGGFEYDAGIYWNNNTKTWSYYVQERSISGHIRILNCHPPVQQIVVLSDMVDKKMY
jgi:hypothetical protein